MSEIRRDQSRLLTSGWDVAERTMMEGGLLFGTTQALYAVDGAVAKAADNDLTNDSSSVAALADERSRRGSIDQTTPLGPNGNHIAFRGPRSKAVLDIFAATLLLVVLTPLFLAVALAIKLTSRGPVLFKQTRHGIGQRDIMVYKFRSMRVEVADPTGANQTERRDPRITRVGAFLRSTSIDELPQLFNVLAGDMSLVGPRPLPTGMRTEGLLCSEIVADYAERHRMKPGITGWAQINGSRGATLRREEVERRIQLDNHYIDNWSLRFDLEIMVLTCWRLFQDENAF